MQKNIRNASISPANIKRFMFTLLLLGLGIGGTSIGRAIQPAAANSSLTMNSEAALLASAIVKTEGAAIMVGESATVDLVIEAGENDIGAATVDLTYDASLFEIEDCAQSAFIGACNTAESGKVKVTGIQPSGVTGNAVLASFDIKALKEGSGNFNIESVSVLADTNGNDVDLTTESGLIGITLPEPEETPTPFEPDPTPNVCSEIVNGDFEDGINSWERFGVLEIVPGRNGNGLSLASGSARQLLDAAGSTNFTLSAYVSIEGDIGNGWTGLGVDYFSGTEEAGEDTVRLTEVTEGFMLVEIEGTTGTDIDAIQVWMFTNSDITFVIDDYEIVWEGCDEVEPTPMPTETPIVPVDPTATPIVPVDPTATPIVPVDPTATPVAPVDPTPTPQPTEAPLEAVIIYDDAVSADWTLSSWGTLEEDTSSTTHVFEGEYALEVGLVDGYSNLYFEASESLSTDDYVSVSLMIYGTATGQTIDLGLLTANFQPVGSTVISIEPNAWKQVEFTFDGLDAGSLFRNITFQDSSLSNSPIYIDNLSLNRIGDGTTGELTNHIYLPVMVK